ncbi:hypothetical protein BKD30_06575 [Tersicoccus phoenicis]|uniref:Uncharacterized protein n=1 Tax=Tersicoccus phoenicis TaxID=554083 RepID=A0A1R1LC63_9MICC|nr:hypothetical protein [Tersicoccus phoenicis]OMH25126.1 hypothetical protein BKD30_06575 [Tersicoccus phoenicis]
MSDDLPRDETITASDILRRLSDRPLGSVAIASGRTLLPFSRSLLTAAQNLLEKAVRNHDDPEKSLPFIDRAVALPYDEHEEAYPAAMAAGQWLFMAVTDAVEEALPGDESWLDAAIAVLRETGDPGRTELRHVLDVVDQDYVVPDPERRRLRRALAEFPPEPGWVELADRPREELRDRVLAVLEVAAAYDEAYAEAAAGALNS